MMVRFGLLFVLLLASWAWAEVGLSGVYDDNYAINHSRCPQHFWQGIPPKHDKGADGTVYPLCFSGFAVLYSGQTRTPIYAAHRLTAKDVLSASNLARTDSFRAEARLYEGHQAQLMDYQGEFYDRGHIVPNGDMADVNRQYDSFSLANIIPQDPTHNRKLWRDIESHVRAQALKYGELYVLTGAAYHGRTAVDMNGVLVPSHLYKAVYVPQTHTAVVYYSPNDGSLTYELIDTRTLKARTGVDFVPNARFEPSPFIMQAQAERQSLGFLGWLGAMWAYAWQKLA